ncbi:MAG: DUF4831 family protein [Bacteroidales bacterium]|jgi:hypothetical protein
MYKNIGWRLTGIISIVVIMTFFLSQSSCISGRKMAEASVSVKPLTNSTGIGSGSLVYALPRSVFTVKVTLERRIEIPGPYAAYAGDFLGLKNVIDKKAERWSLRSISVNSHEEADPSEYYIINARDVFITNVLSMKKEGLILDLNPGSDFRNEAVETGKETNFNQFVPDDLGSDEYVEIQSDTVFRRVRVDSVFIRIPYVVEKKKPLTTEQIAERAAKRLLELRDGKIMILTGEANVFPQSDASINEINRLQKEYTELFTGRTFTESRLFSYDFIPEKENSGKPVTLFMLSDSAGPMEAGSGIGKPVRIEVLPEQKTKDITIISAGEQSKGNSTNDKLFYRIPDLAVIRISLDGKTLYSSRRLVYQMGEVMQLPSNYLLGK